MVTFRDIRSARPLAVIMLVSVLVCSFPVAASGAPQSDAQGPTQQSDAGVRLIRSDTEGLVLELAAPAFLLGAAEAADAAGTAPGAACQQVQMPGYVTSAEEGRPALPVKTLLVAVPPDASLEAVAEPLSVSVSTAKASICPAPTRTREYSDEGRVLETVEDTIADPAVYAASSFYPAQTVRVIDLGFMRSQHIARVEIYPLQFNPGTGELRLNQQLRVLLRFRGNTASGAAVREPEEFESAFRQSLLNYDSASGWRRSTRPAAAAPWAPPNPAYKVMVKEEGIYQVSRQELATAGLPVETLDPRTFKMYNSGQEVAIEVTGQADGQFNEGDVLLFYGQGVKTRYTDENVYWLTYGGVQGLRMAAKASVPADRIPAAFAARVRHEQNLAYISSLPKAPGYDHWYGERLQVAGAGGKTSKQFTLSLPQTAPGSHTARVTAQLGGNYDGMHHVRLYANGQPVYDGKWPARTLLQASADFAQSHLSPGDNTITLELINDTPGQAFDMIYVDWVEVAYEREYVTDNDSLIFGESGPGTWLYQAAGFSSQDIEAYDVSDPARVARMTGLTVGSPIRQLLVFLPLVVRGAAPAAAGPAVGNHSGPVAAPLGPYAVRFGTVQDGAGRYAALTRPERSTVVRIERDASSDVLSSAESVDYIVVTHRDFLAPAQGLATHRASQGLHVKVVDVQEIYDQFGYGLMSAEAIRDFIAYAYSQWPAPAPSHVELIGDGTYDFQGFSGFATPTFIPPYLEMVDPDMGETATDNRYVTITPGDVLPELNIGRLPVNTLEEANAMVDKIVAYEALASADWMQNALFVADDLEGGGGDFYEYSDGIADGSTTYKGNPVKILPAGYTPNKTYLGQTCDLSNPPSSVECRAQIIERINAGSLFVSYIGHGTRTYWAAEKLFDKTALGQINTGGRAPIMLPMTCNEGYFQDPDPTQTSLSEIGVRMKDNGPIASWAPTGFGLAPGHDFLEKGLLLALFYDRVTLGAAASAGKLYLAANAPPGTFDDLIDTFLLLGDSGLKVPVQSPAAGS